MHLKRIQRSGLETMKHKQGMSGKIKNTIRSFIIQERKL